MPDVSRVVVVRVLVSQDEMAENTISRCTLSW